MPGAWSSGKRLLWFSTQLIHISNERKDLVRLSVPLQKHVSSFFSHGMWKTFHMDSMFNNIIQVD